ncbi:MAG: phosphoribosylformylglycinamidine synthase subunit PurQ [Acidimicrobiales bacterium]
MPPRVGVVVFPGSNCEHDAVSAVRRLGGTADLLWHGVTTVTGFDALVLPGGFAHGDYLRPGALARFSPVMEAVAAFAEEGGPVLGICNGFQVLCEAGLLPGALQKNRGLRFLCTTVGVRVDSEASILTKAVPSGTRLRIPINHFEGNYICDQTTLSRLQDEDRIVLRYEENPNGSIDDIAGICSSVGNVVGLMPHPERAIDALLGSTDGSVLLRSFLGTSSERGPARTGISSGCAEFSPAGGPAR